MNDYKPDYDFSDLVGVIDTESVDNNDVHLIWTYRNSDIPIKKFSSRKRIPRFIEIDEEDLK